MLSYIYRRWDSTRSNSKRRQCERLYRLFQFCYNRSCRTMAEWVLWSYYLVNVNSITMIYTSIRFFSEFEEPIVLTLVLVILVEIGAASAYLYQLAVTIRRYSQEYADSHLRYTVSQGNGEKQFWLACRPLETYVGTQFTISSRTFCLEVFCNVILQSAINLLLLRF